MAKKVRLAQVIGHEKDIRQSAYESLTEIHKNSMKPDMVTGLTKEYSPKNEGDEKLPAEKTLVKFSTTDALEEASQFMTELFDITLTRDSGNAGISVSLKIGDTVLIEKVPGTYLLFLKKQLDDWKKFVNSLQTLDPAKEWKWVDGNWRSEPVVTNRTKKEKKALVLYDATEKHPAQVQAYDEDVPVGTWTTVYLSGAIPVTRKKELLARIAQLEKALVEAQEEVNSNLVEQREGGKAIFDFLLSK